MKGGDSEYMLFKRDVIFIFNWLLMEFFFFVFVLKEREVENFESVVSSLK